MTPFRISLAAMMGLVVAVALNLVLLKAIIHSANLFHREALANLFPVNTLVFVLYRLRFGIGRELARPFLKGFFLCGTLAVFVHLACFSLAPERTTSIMDPAIAAFDNVLTTATSSLGIHFAAYRYAAYFIVPLVWPVFFLIASLPQMTFAVAGGWYLHQLQTVRRTVYSDANKETT